MSDPVLKDTPLFANHQSLGAKLVPFAGYTMPVQYAGIIQEHMAVRSAAGLFDVSHMGEVFVSGPEAHSFVQNLVTNDITKLYDGKALYTAMCLPNGGIIDDLLVYRLNEERYLLVVNASNIEKDVTWMRANNPMGADIDDVSEEMSLIALQGPASVAILSKVTSLDVEALTYYHFLIPHKADFLGCDEAIISRTGYTGERGFEIYCRNQDAARVWETILEAGARHGLVPAGLGARDTLRLESGFCLYGNDLAETVNPLEAGLGWVTRFDAGNFIGREVLEEIKRVGSQRKLVAFVMNERGIPRQGYLITDSNGFQIGEVTSGTQSPVLNVGIGMGFVRNLAEFADPGSDVFIEIRGKHVAATVKKPPLHKD